MTDLALCACEQFYKEHHPDCPARRQWEQAADRIEQLESALRYCAGRLEHPRCPRCADRQEVARKVLEDRE